MKAIVEIRTQHASGTWPRCGPDIYVAVQVVPSGVVPLRALNYAAAKRRGIEIIWVGEGYSDRSGPRSAYGQAVTAAEDIAARINGSD